MAVSAKMKTRLVPLILIIGFGMYAGYVISCKDTTTSPSQEIVFPGSNVSFNNHVAPLLQQKCAVPLCHDQNTKASNLDLSFYNSYAQLIDRGMVVPGNSSLSPLIEHINGQLSLMPPSQSGITLTPNQKTGLKTWVDEGAKRN